MKPLLPFIVLSGALHVGGFVWLSTKVESGEGGPDFEARSAAALSLHSSDAVASLVAEWETLPLVATTVEPLAGVPRISEREGEPGPEMPSPKMASLTSPEVPLRDAPPQRMGDLTVASAAGTVPLPDLLQHPSASEKPPVVFAERPTSNAISLPPGELGDAKHELPVAAPDHPGPDVVAFVPPPPRPTSAPRVVQATTSAKAASPSKPAAEPSGARSAWGSAIRLSLARHHRVPDAARRQGLSGRVILRITVAPDGGIAAQAIRSSSGHDLLDKAALAALRRAGRLPAAPSGVVAPMTFDVPLTFQTG